MVGELQRIEVPAEAVGQRIDRFLAQTTELSRSELQRLMQEGMVRVRDRTCRASYALRAADWIELELPAPKDGKALPQDLPLDVVYEDAWLLVVNKPPGLVVHPAPGHPDGTLVNAVLHHCPDLEPIGGVLRPGIVHRIDRDTSGLLVVAKRQAAHEHLARLFAGHDIERRYRAVVHGARRLADEGSYETLYGRHPQDRKRFSSKVERGRRAATHWRVVERFDRLAAVTVELETGRSHQIRVHFSDHGHPLVGDAVYGGERADRGLPPAQARLAQRMGRQALHAELLGFVHPATGRALRFEAPLPADMGELLEGLRSLTSAP